jgi:catechol 2,3-dioxygenase-like lactoylglutathione lyase family enzyme
MTSRFRGTRDVIIRTDNLDSAVRFYESVLALPVTHRDSNLVGFNAGAFTLYVEGGEAHGPVFELLVPNVEKAKAQLLASGCRVLEEDSSLPRCYIQDPQGFTFNIGLDRDAV